MILRSPSNHHLLHHNPPFYITLFLERAVALLIHILITYGIPLAPRRALSSWIELYSCFPPPACHERWSCSHSQNQEGRRKKGREAERNPPPPNKKRTQASQEKTWESVRGWFYVQQFSEGQSISQTHPPLPLILVTVFSLKVGTYEKNSWG